MTDPLRPSRALEERLRLDEWLNRNWPLMKHDPSEHLQSELPLPLCDCSDCKQIAELRDLFSRAEAQGRAAQQEHLEMLARAMRKVLPPHLLTEMLAHLDPLTPFLQVVREFKDESRSPDGDGRPKGTAGEVFGGSATRLNGSADLVSASIPEPRPEDINRLPRLISADPSPVAGSEPADSRSPADAHTLAGQIRDFLAEPERRVTSRSYQLLLTAATVLEQFADALDRSARAEEEQRKALDERTAQLNYAAWIADDVRRQRNAAEAEVLRQAKSLKSLEWFKQQFRELIKNGLIVPDDDLALRLKEQP